jgi:hypothetical protein
MTSRRRGEPGPGDWRGTLGRLALRLADQMLGVDERPAANRPRQAERVSEPPPVGHAADQESAADAAKALEHALTQFESVLERMERRSASPPAAREEELIAQAGPFAPSQEPDEPPAELDEFLAGLEDEPIEQWGEDAERDVSDAHELSELRRMVREVARRLEDAIDRFDSEGLRLADRTQRLAEIATRLEDRLLDLEQRPAAQEAFPSTHAAPSHEPQFAPGNGAVDLVLTQVPDFQGLMKAHRALNDLPSQASVVAFKNGEASLEVQLRAPVSAQQIVEGLRNATGHRLLIEEARPESNRLRLRFIDDGG